MSEFTDQLFELLREAKACVTFYGRPIDDAELKRAVGGLVSLKFGLMPEWLPPIVRIARCRRTLATVLETGWTTPNA